MVGHANIEAISFTGGESTGRGNAATAVGRMAKVHLEMGGKNPLVILDDADLAIAVNCAVQGAYFSTGQRRITSLKHAMHCKRNAQAGMVMVNCPTAGVDYHGPFAGRKDSSMAHTSRAKMCLSSITLRKPPIRLLDAPACRQSHQ